MPAHIREMFDTAVHAHEDAHRTIETAMREMEGAEKARDAVVIDEQNPERENGGLWQYYSTNLSVLTVPPGPFRCQACSRQRVDLTILPAHVGTRAIMAKGTIRIFRRYVSWVTTTAPMPHARIVSLRLVGGAERLHRSPNVAFHPPHQSLPLTRVTPNRVTPFLWPQGAGNRFNACLWVPNEPLLR